MLSARIAIHQRDQTMYYHMVSVRRKIREDSQSFLQREMPKTSLIRMRVTSERRSI